MGIITGGFVAIMAGSDSDMPHLENIQKELAKLKIPSAIRICSAHKQPGRLETIIGDYNKSVEPMLIVGCAGGTDALSGTASYLSRHPVPSRRYEQHLLDKPTWLVQRFHRQARQCRE